MATALRFINRIQDADDFADALTWAGAATFSSTVALSDNVTQADAKYIATDQIRARDGDGLLVTGDGGKGMFIKDGGFAGFGTVVPGAQIHAVGDAVEGTPSLAGRHIGVFQQTGNPAADASVAIISGQTTGHSTLEFGDKDLVDIGNIRYYHADNSLRVTVNSVEAMILDSNGKCGLGTNSPSHTLDVQGASAQIDINSTSGDPILALEENGAWAWKIGYSISGNYLFFHSTDIDGGGTDGQVIRIPDGQTDIHANTDWLDDQFDYVCQSCGWHHVNEHTICPECGGVVKWQDDAALVHNMLHAPDKGHYLRAMERQGLLDLSDAVQTETGYKDVFMPLQTMQQFSLSAIAQLWKRVEDLEAQLPAR